MSESTFHYYSQHAQEFADATRNVDMQPLYTPFLQALQDKPNSQLHILDAGCGSGRDALNHLIKIRKYMTSEHN
ncbi:hypothetical protein N473_18410 [Pseudoalteromonas luteoviolacea CPMOR-1]|uniref:Methyltransferase domain-containing protein n=1 Tax=Pseudoalteromonas luteoviolacea CPMOR-1 TaxID=1365248 RepID=A0A167KJH3_9GAMM|nr:hypothetical protein [Pseudoalteromonas luteoviolacea]KZN62889.1 hypothetical protein N473_18410 [Pseudoalteromonas luteoviolacea CPMOR-1]